MTEAELTKVDEPPIVPFMGEATVNVATVGIHSIECWLRRPGASTP